MCSIFVHCLGVILISGQVIISLPLYTANLTCNLTQTEGLYVQLTIFSNLVRVRAHTHSMHHTESHPFSIEPIPATETATISLTVIHREAAISRGY